VIKLDIRGLPEVRSALNNLAQEQIPFAMMVAINNTAFKVRAALQDEMKSVFDRPTPWLIRQVAVAKATKTSLTAVVGTPEGIRDMYGNPTGFSRTSSSGVYERIISPQSWVVAVICGLLMELEKAGILPPGWRAVPAPDAPLDSYGNLSAQWWMMLLSWLNAAQWSSQGAIQNRAEKTSNRKNRLQRAGMELFAAIPGRPRTRHLQPGIYARQRKNGLNTIKPLLLFVRSVTYKKRLDWTGIATRTVETELPDAMASAVRLAIETAR
jgi:hypothetical protein